MRATAALLREAGSAFSIESVEIDDPMDDEILVKISAVGICHTDLVFAAVATASQLPLILGHEGAGIVERVGTSVRKVKPGDKVLLTFDSCGVCKQCNTHNPSYCQHFSELNFTCVRADGTSHVHIDDSVISAQFFGQSSFASLVITRERNTVLLSPDADLAALAPLGCGIQTGVGGVLRSLRAQPGSSIVVIGGGAVGLSAVLGSVIADCATIIVIEPRIERRVLALDLGAHHVIDPAGCDTVAAVRAIVSAGVDNVFDTSGNVDALEAAIGMLAPKGTLGMVGVPGSLEAVLSLPIVTAISFGLTVKGIIEGDSDPDTFLPALVELHRDGRLPIDRFVRYYPFDHINQAIADLSAGLCVKAVLRLDPSKRAEY